MFNPGGSGPGHSGGPSGSGNPSGRKGARISVEPFEEWKIQEILYNGAERYLRPEELVDHVGRMAHQVDWKKVLGSDAVYDNPYLDMEEEEAPEETKKVPVEEMVVPDAGPWHTVAKYLHESLQQMNVFLDNLNVLKETNYVEALTILDPIHSEPNPDAMVSNNRSSQWVWKRRALSDAGAVLEKAVERMGHTSGDPVEQDHRQRGQFFMELKKMREYWRVRKTGDHIYGDLGYHIFGSKYNQRELFDITRRSMPETYYAADRSRIVGGMRSETLVKSVLQVKVPRDLARRSTLSVSIIKDDHQSKDVFAKLDDLQFEYMRLDASNAENIHWDNALKWAQETLICRDTFETLCTEAVQMSQRMSTIRDGVLLVSVCDNLLLRIELKYHPFQDTPPGKESRPDGDSYLNRSLRQMIVAKECSRWIRPQVFVSLPVTHLCEPLDVRGPRALTQKDIEERAYRPQRTLEKMINVSAHYSLVKMTIDTLRELILSDPDPQKNDVQVHYRFLRCTPTHTQIMVTMTNRNYDYIINKTPFYIRISPTDIVVMTKEGTTIDCYRDRNQLLYNFKLMLVNFAVSAVFGLARTWWWYQMLHANMNALDANGNPAPSLYMVNESSTRMVFIQFALDAPPVIKVKKIVPPIVRRTFQEPADINAEFKEINYKRIPGSTLCKKIDNLLAIFRESETCAGAL